MTEPLVIEPFSRTLAGIRLRTYRPVIERIKVVSEKGADIIMELSVLRGNGTRTMTRLTPCYEIVTVLFDIDEFLWHF